MTPFSPKRRPYERDGQRVAGYLSHILQAIERIHRCTDEMDEVVFSRDELTQDPVIRNFEIIGEACRNIERNDPDFAAAHPELPLAIAYEMRNALAHGHFKSIWRSFGRASKPICRLCAKRRGLSWAP